MQRDSKLGYGFLLVGASIPYLIEHLFGASLALLVTIFCAILGVGFLCAGHVHRRPEDPPLTFKKKTITGVLATAVTFSICLMGWKMHTQSIAKGGQTVVLPYAPPQDITQEAKHSDCSNIVAKDVQIKCETEKEKEHGKAKP
jgi:hypothetical protein